MKGISVIIPAYCAEDYIKEAVESVRAQLLGEVIEIIVIDDGSSDGTVALAKQLADVLLVQNHQGAAAARNKGICAAKGEWVCLLDADDVLTVGAIDAMLVTAMSDEHIQVVFGKAIDFISSEIPQEEKDKLKPRYEAYGGILPGCSLIKKQVFEAIGLFDTERKSGETVDWIMRLRATPIPTAEIEYVTLHRRLHLTNTGRLSPQTEMSNYAAILRHRLRGRKG